MADSNQIKTIQELVESLDLCNQDDFKKLGQRLAIAPPECGQYTFYSADRYTRNCIALTDEYELLLLCWEAGQQTPVHCHNDQECWVYVVQGEIEEELFEETKDNPKGIKLLKEQQMPQSAISYMNDEMGFHRLKNVHSDRSMTLHLYVKPIDGCNVYQEASNQFEFIQLSYHSKGGNLLRTGV